ncbi:MAG: hypothetical protein KKA73_21855 [Chloroflexi bacterium]|nr:hypothetical protein [Chloroflexota bacterium]MBU1750339.1 hypothetical protein [Chloroflexota bacterium]MBU1879301.1 hypothetical protein [Chloroflexota bacterium]
MIHRARPVLSAVARFMLAVVLVGTVLGVVSGSARADNPITVSGSTTASEFPQALVFRLSATDSAADITKIELRFKQRGDASTEIAKPEFVPGRQVEATYRWKTDKTQVPPGAAVEFYWIVSDAAGNTLTTETQTVFYDDLRFPWKQRRNDDIAFYWYKGSDDFGDYVFNVATSALGRISTDIGAQVEYPIRIYAYANQDDFRSAFPSLGGTRLWIGGQAFPDLAITVQILPDAGDDTDWIHDVIPHEISHLVFYQATHHPPADPPRWLDEGLAQYNEESDQWYAIALVEDAAENGTLFSLKVLSGSFFNDPDKTRLAYAESYHAVGYIFDTYGREGMARLIAAFGAGKTRDAAFQEALGLSLDDFDQQWQRSLGVTPATALPSPTPLPTEDRPWLNPTAPPWAKKTPGGPEATAITPTTPGTPVVQVQTPPPVAPTGTPVPGNDTPVWLTVVGGTFCCASAVLAVAFLVGLVWLVRR